ncbi:orotidine-5'-phosphate decarboxylase [Fictibacillus nanhaiensis]|uniref:orotidine-5'-phosphate decarboxylase n=1 Tax=Fictibacillus nanhaiensis TaxID=742169 RepID=UPI001C97AD9E|nr:orotidine-5'-phosphate decarboxylase [Fictibacillus nanhaiensis]MBY6036157.1 orotidine-5'-phosphate decarboxylase [Fictibacillus nanhaiensis]
MENPVIIALDFENGKKAKKFLSAFEGHAPYVKVGMELFYAEGAPFIYWLKERNFQVFLDLKLHDIPTTVNKAMKVLGSLSIDMVNVHAAGGTSMMKAAKEGLISSGSSHTKLIAVTQLTSTNERMLYDELLIQHTTVKECATHYAMLAKNCGLDGVVCSAQETKGIKEACGSSFLSITPGIRPSGSDIHDQARTATPKAAAEAGVDYMVIGRSITKSEQPVDMYETIVKEWRDAYAYNNRQTFA